MDSRLVGDGGVLDSRWTPDCSRGGHVRAALLRSRYAPVAVWIEVWSAPTGRVEEPDDHVLDTCGVQIGLVDVAGVEHAERAGMVVVALLFGPQLLGEVSRQGRLGTNGGVDGEGGHGGGFCIALISTDA